MAASTPPECGGGDDDDDDAGAAVVGGGKVLMGTCGWSDTTIMACKRFYPGWVRTGEDRLRHYATHWACAEVDSSNYAIPTAKTVAKWMALTTPGFVFHFKSFGLFTNASCPLNALPWAVRETAGDIPARDNRATLATLPEPVYCAVWSYFNAVLDVAHKAGKLGCVVFQFPLTFHPSQASKAHVADCRQRLSSAFTMAVEFRDRGWTAEGRKADTLAWLREVGAVYVCADELEHETYLSRPPPGPGEPGRVIPFELHITHPSVAYVRVHRREGTKRLLPADDIAKWAERLKAAVRELGPRGRTFFLGGTDWEDQPVINGRNLAAALGPEFALDWASVARHRTAARKGTLLGMLTPAADGASSASPTSSGRSGERRDAATSDSEDPSPTGKRPRVEAAGSGPATPQAPTRSIKDFFKRQAP